MARGSKAHTHRYRRITVAGSNVWACSLPDCSHYMPKHLEAAVEGKNTICFGCGETFVLDKKAMEDDFPMCSGCRTIAEPIATNERETNRSN